MAKVCEVVVLLMKFGGVDMHLFNNAGKVVGLPLNLIRPLEFSELIVGLFELEI